MDIKILFVTILSVTMEIDFSKTIDFLARIKSIAHPRFRDDEFGSVGIFFYFFSKLCHENPQILCLVGIAVAPNFFQQIMMGQHSAFVFYQNGKQIVFGCRKFQDFLFQFHDSRSKINRNIPKLDYWFILFWD